METTEFSTKPLLRPAQLEEMQSQVKTAEAKLSNPAILDKGEARKQLQRTKATLESQTPRPPVDAVEEGRMVSRQKHLLDQILVGMPSQEEMRKAPPGAVDKHMAWEKRNKPKILEWKNLQLRLKPGEREAANLERHRPSASTLNMDNAYIQGKQIHIPDGVGNTVTFNDAQINALRLVSPQLADALSLMSNQERGQVKDAIAGIGLAEEPSAASIAGKRGVEKREARKRTLSPEHKAAMQAGREAKAKKAA